MEEYFINSFFRGVLWEFLAALAALIYLKRLKNVPLYKRIFIFYLCAMFLVDVMGYYVAIAYYSDYRIFGFTRGTVFQQNYWMFNAVKPFAILVYLQFFIAQIRSIKLRKGLTWAAGVFLVSSILNLIFSGEFFIGYITYTPIAGSILLSITIGCYLFEMLTVDRTLIFFKSLSFFVAVGSLIWHLVFTPMFVFNNFSVMDSTPEFVKVYLMTLGLLNFFMYSMFIIGFFVEMKNRQRVHGND